VNRLGRTAVIAGHECVQDAADTHADECVLEPHPKGVRGREFHAADVGAAAELVHQTGEDLGCPTFDGRIVRWVIQAQSDNDVAFLCQSHDHLMEAPGP
jgi:hypothetical protein